MAIQKEFYYGCRRRYNTRYMTATHHWYRFAQWLKNLGV